MEVVCNSMYEIRFKGSKAKKDFKKLLLKLSPQVKKRLKETLENNPHPTASFGESLNKVERKGILFCYPVRGGDRVLYDIVEVHKKKQIVLIHFSGNHDGEVRYLEKHSK